MKRIAILGTTLSTLAVALALGISVGAAHPAQAAGTTCQNIPQPQLPGAVVQSMTGTSRGADLLSGVPAHCEVTLHLTHPGDGDDVRVDVWLPSTGWNGRFQGTGGAGWSAGLLLGNITVSDTVPTIPAAVKNGYAAAATDAGVGFNPFSAASWALKADGTVNTGLLTDFSSRSVHDMTVASKQIITSFYGRSPSYSYWNGCSTGGRQGLMEAQRYPTDYNGILASAPAINWDRFIPAELWPQVVMNQAKDFPSPCKFNAFTQAAIAACDKSDGAPADGIIDQPETCGFDPRSLIGKVVLCDAQLMTITATDAEVVRRIWQGPTSVDGQQSLWYGVLKGAAIDQLANTSTDLFGKRRGSPFSASDNWFKYFLSKQPSFDTSTVTPAQFVSFFNQSKTEYNQIIGTDNPDLTAFKNAGGKMITWHGQTDPFIFPQGTVNYLERVWSTMGGAQSVNSFYRAFLAPGVGHCGLAGNGPVPTSGGFDAVVNWVEKGQAPATLPAATTDSTGAAVTRNLCPYPQVSKYNGQGNPKSATSYQCTG